MTDRKTTAWAPCFLLVGQHDTALTVLCCVSWYGAQRLWMAPKAVTSPQSPLNYLHCGSGFNFSPDRPSRPGQVCRNKWTSTHRAREREKERVCAPVPWPCHAGEHSFSRVRARSRPLRLTSRSAPAARVLKLGTGLNPLANHLSLVLARHS